MNVHTIENEAEPLKKSYKVRKSEKKCEKRRKIDVLCIIFGDFTKYGLFFLRSIAI